MENEVIDILQDISYFPRFDNSAAGVRKIRSLLHLSKSKLARIIGVSHVTIYYWEIGKRRPRPQIERKLVMALNKLEGKS